MARQTAEGKAIYSKRKSTVETVFGVIKEVLGFRHFHLRGLRGAEGEWSLVCTAWNLKRLYALAEDKWGQCVPVDELWRRNGHRRHLGGCCWHHDPSRRTSIPPGGPASGTRLSATKRSRARRPPTPFPGLAHFVIPRPGLRQTPSSLPLAVACAPASR